MNYNDLFIIDKDRIVSIIERSHYSNQIHYIIIIVINKKIMNEKQQITNHPIYPIYNKPKNRSEIRNRRWSLDSYNTSTDSPKKLSTIIENYGGKQKISPEDEHTMNNRPVPNNKSSPKSSLSNISFISSQQSSPKSSSNISFISSQRSSQNNLFISTNEEYEYIEEYLYGLSLEHIRMIVKYYNIYFKNLLITKLLNNRNNTHIQQMIMLKWLYGYIDSYIHNESTDLNNIKKKQKMLEKYMNQQLKPNSYILSHLSSDDILRLNAAGSGARLRPSLVDPSSSFVELSFLFETTSRPSVKPSNSPGDRRSPSEFETNKSFPSDKITISQRIYRLLSKSWKCFSTIILYFWVFTIRICMG